MHASDIDGGQMIAIVGVVFGCLIAMLAIVMGSIRSTLRTRQREQSRREIAAYIAEGSMTPAEGERLMAAGEDPRRD
jgi:hypothetical protein